MIKDSLFSSNLKVICNNVYQQKNGSFAYYDQNSILGLISNNGLRTKSLEEK